MKRRSTVPKAPARCRAGARLQNRLERGLHCWNLRFGGRSTVLRHSRGVVHIAHLLSRPNAGPIHALQLAAWADSAEVPGAAIELPTLEGRAAALVTANAQISQRSLYQDNLEGLRRLRQKVKALEAVVDDPDETECVRAEAREELAGLRRAQNRLLRTNEDAPCRVVRAVRRAIWRVVNGMAAAVDHRGQPVPVLRDLARHLHLYLVVPSSRYLGPRAISARAELEGCFQYTPPKGVQWTIH